MQNTYFYPQIPIVTKLFLDQLLKLTCCHRLTLFLSILFTKRLRRLLRKLNICKGPKIVGLACVKAKSTSFPWKPFPGKSRSQRVQFTTRAFSWCQPIIKLIFFLQQIKSFFSLVSRYLSNQLYFFPSSAQRSHWNAGLQRIWPGRPDYKKRSLPRTTTPPGHPIFLKSNDSKDPQEACHTHRRYARCLLCSWRCFKFRVCRTHLVF